MTTTAKKETTAARWDSLEGELAMEKGHAPAWMAMIDQMQEKNLSQKTILDFGCNRGGFLRALYHCKPFAKAVGVDIATDAIKDAQGMAGTMPITYALPDILKNQSAAYDIVFSHEVIYLLPDLAAHARDIYTWLKPGGAYYLAIGEYAENPLWPRWEKIVREFSSVPPQTYGLQHIAETFQKQGFSTGVTRLNCKGFLPYDATEKRYLHTPQELVKFMCDDMMYFRFEK